MKRINDRKSSMAAKIEKEAISDIKNVFCKYCNEAFYTQRAVDVHIMTLHAEEGERETKRAKRRKEMGMDEGQWLIFFFDQNNTTQKEGLSFRWLKVTLSA